MDEATRLALEAQRFLIVSAEERRGTLRDHLSPAELEASYADTESMRMQLEQQLREHGLRRSAPLRVPEGEPWYEPDDGRGQAPQTVDAPSPAPDRGSPGMEVDAPWFGDAADELDGSRHARDDQRQGPQDPEHRHDEGPDQAMAGKTERVDSTRAAYERARYSAYEAKQSDDPDRMRAAWGELAQADQAYRQACIDRVGPEDAETFRSMDLQRSQQESKREVERLYGKLHENDQELYAEDVERLGHAQDELAIKQAPQMDLDDPYVFRMTHYDDAPKPEPTRAERLRAAMARGKERQAQERTHERTQERERDMGYDR
ncbi:hypothetical protein GTQ99_00665 [Kineococcus sp. T13]|uniref:hypothetical protein n=1 Tax=Kineococcus vitellinus TaxID=2696565 RepID=UPI001412298D|nr:hypothetical protein [Kineococcus vitellinus]NAZ73944.1 hypothetical protein [Kineococcus vitellinus]